MAQHSISLRHKMKSLLVIVLIYQILLFSHNDGEVNQSQRQLEVHEEGGQEQNHDAVEKDNDADKDTRPIMYTFFSRIKENVRSTGMSDDSDDAMLDLWQQQWNVAGFQTKVLTFEDAKRHPRFDEFQELLKKVPLDVPTKIYNQMCYYRHLAMAAVGGGYMSDYDVLPLIKEDSPKKVQLRPSPGDHTSVISLTSKESNDTEVTIRSLQPVPITENDEVVVYSMTARNGGVPCLMSGPAKKWETLAFAMVNNGVQHARDESLWSDMLAMIDLNQSDSFLALGEGTNADIIDEPLKPLYDVQNYVLKRFPIKEFDWMVSTKYRDICRKINEMVAVHFSHFSLKEAGQSPSERPKVAKQWLEDWRSYCHKGNVSEYTDTE